MTDVRVGASICRSTEITETKYIQLKNLNEKNIKQAESELNEVETIGRLFIFLSGNDLFRSRNFRDKNGNLHGHRVNKRLRANEVKSLMTKYKGLIRIAKERKAKRIIIVPCYVRNLERVCKNTFQVCSERKLIHRFTMSYSKKIINVAMKNLKQLIKPIGMQLSSVSLDEFEQACIGDKLSAKQMSKLEITRRIIGMDDVHYQLPCYHRLGQFLGSYEWEK